MSQSLRQQQSILREMLRKNAKIYVIRKSRAIILKLKYLHSFAASISSVAKENERKYRYSEIIREKRKFCLLALYSAPPGMRKWNIKDFFWNFNL